MSTLLFLPNVKKSFLDKIFFSYKIEYNARQACPLLNIKFFLFFLLKISLYKTVSISTIDRQLPTCDDLAL